LNGKVHLFGGRTADVSDNLDRHDVYDPKTNTWTPAAPLPRPRSAGAYAVLDGRIIYAGGECKPGGAPFSPNTYDDVTAYDPRTDRWTSLTQLPQGRHAFGAATVNNVAYFVGGAPVCAGGAMTDMLSLRVRK
jgi:N-acetylneuraminic acid mutarotase